MKERGGGILEKMSMMMMIQVDFGSEQSLDSRSMCGTRIGIFLPLSEFFLFFFPLYENTVEAV